MRVAAASNLFARIESGESIQTIARVPDVEEMAYFKANISGCGNGLCGCLDCATCQGRDSAAKYILSL